MNDTLLATDTSLMLKTAIDAALKAGRHIFAFQKSPSLGIRIKRDLSPVTKADKMAQQIIGSALSVFSIPMISEEEGLPDWSQRKSSPAIWIVDPLDGTKEYIARRPEYTVNIALVKNSVPQLGVVYAPACGQLYFASAESGAYRVADIPADSESFNTHWLAEKLPLQQQPERPYTVVVSRSHLSRDTRQYIRELKRQYSDVEVISAGSSLKICRVAEGSADIYPRFGRTMEWDTAAAHAVLLYAGGNIRLTGDINASLTYNKSSMGNPSFIAYR